MRAINENVENSMDIHDYMETVGRQAKAAAFDMSRQTTDTLR